MEKCLFGELIKGFPGTLKLTENLVLHIIARLCYENTKESGNTCLRSAGEIKCMYRGTAFLFSAVAAYCYSTIVVR